MAFTRAMGSRGGRKRRKLAWEGMTRNPVASISLRRKAFPLLLFSRVFWRNSSSSRAAKAAATERREMWKGSLTFMIDEATSGWAIP
ncbi:MAG: hypothetical protein BWY86_01238 [Candidatus Aminicenantes bacterium ADurb.Bin508]|nr:MAG: hypothetical protein BWY86_01238 [Candidatus Aminicenantes bacterium ADurb.Bin508]